MGKKLEEVEVEVIFPERYIKVGDEIITISPLPLDKVSLLVEAFNKILAAVLNGQGENQSAVISTLITETLTLIPFCVDVEMNKIPAPALPVVIGAFMDQNFTEDTISRFLELFPRVRALVESITTAMNERFSDQPLTDSSQPDTDGQK